MWRAMFLAIGIYLLILGAQTLGVKEVTLTLRERPKIAAKDIGKQVKPKLGPQRKLTPPAWAPWSLMSTGAVVCLYSFTIPRRVHG